MTQMTVSTRGMIASKRCIYVCHSHEGVTRKWRIVVDFDNDFINHRDLICRTKDGKLKGLRRKATNVRSDLSVWKMTKFILLVSPKGDVERLLNDSMKKLGITDFSWEWEKDD